MAVSQFHGTGKLIDLVRSPLVCRHYLSGRTCVEVSPSRNLSTLSVELLSHVQGDGMHVPEDVLLKELWGFDWDERWLQCFSALAFGGVFLALAVFAGAKFRFIQ